MVQRFAIYLATLAAMIGLAPEFVAHHQTRPRPRQHVVSGHGWPYTP